MVPPKMIIADFAITNDFNTRYIPKNETVNLTIRVQNVGEGDSEFVDVNIKKIGLLNSWIFRKINTATLFFR